MPATDLPLRDIHLPAPPGWWPPAIGWWLLLALLLMLISLWLWRRHRRLSHRAVPLKAARQVLQQIESAHAASGDDAALLRDLSALLRQICVALYPRAEAASLTGDRWLELLDSPLAEPGFRQGPGRILAEGPYRRGVELDPAALTKLVHAWLDALQAAPGRDGDATA